MVGMVSTGAKRSPKVNCRVFCYTNPALVDALAGRQFSGSGISVGPVIGLPAGVLIPSSATSLNCNQSAAMRLYFEVTHDDENHSIRRLRVQ